MDAPHPDQLRGGLPFQQVHFVGEYGLAIAEEGDNDAEADGGFPGGHDDDEKREDLCGDVAKDAGKSDEIDVHGVENKFDGHEYDKDISAGEYAKGTDEEQC